jgi:uncharacterized membrane protein
MGTTAPTSEPGQVAEPSKAAPDPLRHHKHYLADRRDPQYSTFMERVSEKVASGMGTVTFLVISTGLILAWVFVNGAAHYVHTTIVNLAHGRQFDQEPWILLNLIFSAVAFFTGALVIIAQKAQTRTDKANEEAAARHGDELSQLHTDMLRQNTELTTQIHTLTTQLHTLMEQVHTATCAT